MIQRLYKNGDLVISTLDPEPRIYRVKNATYRNDDWTYTFHQTGQGGSATEPKIRQQFLIKVTVYGEII